MKVDPKLTSFEEYRLSYRDPDFGRDVAQKIARQHGVKGILRRNVHASNVVFEFSGAWLKLFPLFWREAYLAELKVLATWGDQVPIPIPSLLASGSIDGWNYLITTHVAGERCSSFRETLSLQDRVAVARQLGHLIGEIARMPSLGLLCNGSRWPDFARYQIEQAEAIHRERARRDVWPVRIADFLRKHGHLVLNLRNIRTVHADISDQHLLFERSSKTIAGLIDFADAMDAPVELEFVLPFLDFFRGDPVLQQQTIQSSGVEFGFSRDDYSFGMMALTLLNRFIGFEEWFDAEISRSDTDSVEDVARIAFPSWKSRSVAERS